MILSIPIMLQCWNCFPTYSPHISYAYAFRHWTWHFTDYYVYLDWDCSLIWNTPKLSLGFGLTINDYDIDTVAYIFQTKQTQEKSFRVFQEGLIKGNLTTRFLLGDEGKACSNKHVPCMLALYMWRIHWDFMFTHRITFSAVVGQHFF